MDANLIVAALVSGNDAVDVIDAVGADQHRYRARIPRARASVGLREELDGRWLVSFAKLDLGHADLTGFTPL